MLMDPLCGARVEVVLEGENLDLVEVAEKARDSVYRGEWLVEVTRSSDEWYYRYDVDLVEGIVVNELRMEDVERGPNGEWISARCTYIEGPGGQPVEAHVTF